MAALPFAARALVGTIPEATLSGPPVTLKEMIEGFVQQFPQVKDMIVNVMQSGASTFVMHCRNTHDAENLLHCGLKFRGQDVAMVPAPNTQWVKLTRVVYGTTENAIKSRLTEYGNVLKMKQERIHGIGISVYSVKMEVKKPIPSRITIAHYPVNVFYRGQVQQCFRCEQTGHQSKSCPFKKTVAPPSARIVGPVVEHVSPEPEIGGPSVEQPEIDGPPVELVPSDPPRSASDPSVSIDTDDPFSIPPPLEAVIESTEMSDVSSQVSTSTPRAESGKRQHKPDSTGDLPATKRDKPAPPPPYWEYERETTRIRFLRGLDKAEPEDDEEYKQFMALFPRDLRRRYDATYGFRHPMLVPEASRSSKAFQVYTRFRIPASMVDFSDDAFMHPDLPKDFPEPSLSYFQFELSTVYEQIHDQFPTHFPVPLPKRKQTQIEEMPDELREAYKMHFCLLHPEMSLNLSEEHKDLIFVCIDDRTGIKYVEQ